MKYPIYPITFSYVSGIFCSIYLGLSFAAALSIAAVASCFLLFMYIVQRNKAFNKTLNLLTIVSVFFAFASLGYLAFTVKNKPVVIENLNENEFTFKVTDVLKANNYSHRVYANLISHQKQPKVLVSFSNKSKIPKIGSVYKLVGTIKTVAEPKNLYGFNYKSYLKNNQINYQITSYNKPFKIAEEPSINSIVVGFRDYLIAQFSKLGYPEKTQGFIETLLFGKKNNLNDEIQQQFKDFGILHVLAVSGMHVVLLFSTISYILSYLRVPKKAVTVILVLFLLIFSLMAGFSGSVVRASLMCLMAIIGTVSGRRINTTNILVGSMLIILLIDPNYLFDVGFQLSYLAVFAIVFCYPIIQSYFTFKNWILNYFGQLIGISLVAQLGVLPLSIYYFKQIPLLFLIGNLIAIPITSFLLSAWFLQMLLSLISVKIFALPTPFLNEISTFCFDSLSKLSDYFSVKTIDFHFTIFQTILALLLVYCGFWFFQRKSATKFFVFLGLLIGFQLVSIKELIENSHEKQLILMSDNKKAVFLKRSGNKIHQIGTAKKYTLQSIHNYALHNSARIIKVDSLSNNFMVNNENWLIIDSLSVYPKKSFQVVVLQQNAKVNLERLIQYTQPKLIILHNSNSQYLIDEYAAYFDKRKIPYYDMRKKGSYVIDYNSGNN